MTSKQEPQACQKNSETDCQRVAVNFTEVKTQCQHCDMNPVCHPPGLKTEELDSLDQWFPTRRRLKRGEALYEIGDPFTAIYAMRSAFFKTILPSHEQRDQITGVELRSKVSHFR